ncbi:MAG: LuxR C-terminal-related transcriptional regulator [Chloroflexota bacterium]
MKAQEKAPIRVVIVAPRLMLRTGLREMLRGLNDITVVGEAASPIEIDSTDTDGPAAGLFVADVLLVASASMDWFSAATGFSRARAVLLLGDDAELAQALIDKTGTWGVLPADPGPEELAAGIHALHEGLVVLPVHLAARVFRAAKQDNVRGLGVLAEPLTAREGEVLGLLAQGLANKQIAARLGISEHTVKFHISSLFAKLGANSRTEAVRLGMLLGLIVI